MSAAAALLLALAAPQLAPSPAPGGVDAAGPVASITMALDRRTGMAGAGLACLPAGVTTGRQFVADQQEFASVLRSELADLPPGMAARLPFAGGGHGAIALAGIDSKLCAKGYGMFGRGDTRSVAGSATFSFDWSATNAGGIPRQGSSRIALRLGKQEALTPPGWLRLALRRFLAELAGAELAGVEPAA